MSRNELITKCDQLKLQKEPKTFPQNRQVAKEGGHIAGGARKKLEKQLERSVISDKKFLDSRKSIG